MLSKCWLQGQPQTHHLLILIWAISSLEALLGMHVELGPVSLHLCFLEVPGCPTAHSFKAFGRETSPLNG